MIDREILTLIGKKYSFEILMDLHDMNNVRFKDLKKACPIEKMRTQRLKELEKKGLIKPSVHMDGRRPILIYDISNKGKKLVEGLTRITV